MREPRGGGRAEAAASTERRTRSGRSPGAADPWEGGAVTLRAQRAGIVFYVLQVHGRFMALTSLCALRAPGSGRGRQT